MKPATNEEEMQIKTARCGHCDMGGGYRGGSYCGKCDGAGSQLVAMGRWFPNTKKGYYEALAFLRKGEP